MADKSKNETLKEKLDAPLLLWPKLGEPLLNEVIDIENISDKPQREQRLTEIEERIDELIEWMWSDEGRYAFFKRQSISLDMVRAWGTRGPVHG